MKQPSVPRMSGRLAEVLVVENNPTDLVLLKLLLMKSQRLRFSLHHAPNGDEALTWLRHRRDAGQRLPDLILLDVHMPHMDGFAVLEILSTERALGGIPVIMLSASVDDHECNGARRHDAGFMGKPATIEKLQKALQKVPQLQLVREGEDYRLLAG